MPLTTATANGLAESLLNGGASFRVGGISFDLRVDSGATAAEVADLYAGYPRLPADRFCDHSLSVRETWLRHRNYYRGPFRRQVLVRVDAEAPFLAYPRDHALPLIESAMNWAVALQNMEYLILHAAAVERDGRVLVMPGTSGSGKSTLCAALIGRGWRLLSDEFAFVRLDDARIQPHPRPVALKNDSIALIAGRNPGAHFSRVYPETAKGRVAYVRAPEAALREADAPGEAGLIVYPRFQAGASLELTLLGKAASFERLMSNNTNYRTLMRPGFEALSHLVDRCRHYEMRFAGLDTAIARLEALMRERPAQDPPA